MGHVGRVERKSKGKSRSNKWATTRVHANARMNCTVCSGINLGLGYLTIMDGAPSVVVDTAVTYVGVARRAKESTMPSTSSLAAMSSETPI